MHPTPLPVLQLNLERGWRGGERQTLFALRGLRQAGWPTALLARAGQPLARQAQAEGFAVVEVGTKPQALAWLARQGQGFGVLHCQTSGTQTLAVLTQPLHRRPVLYTRRVDFVPHGALTRAKYWLTDRVVGISPAVCQIVQPLVRQPVRCLSDVAVRAPIDAARAVAFVGQLGWQAHPIIGVVAALVPHKDPLTGVRAAAALRQTHPQARWLHLGEGPLRPAVSAEIARLGLQDVYRLAGHLAQAEDFYAVFDAFCMSSAEEGLGSSVLDAFLCRVPVACTTAGGLGWLGAEGRAQLVAPHQPKALAEALGLLLDWQTHQPDALAQQLDAAQHYAQTQHSLEAITAGYLEIYQEMMRQK